MKIVTVKVITTEDYTASYLEDFFRSMQDNNEIISYAVTERECRKAKDKPKVDIEGISSPKIIFTDNGLILIGWYDATTGFWNCIEANHNGFDKETFGNVMEYRDISDYPDDFHLDEEQYR